MKPQNDGHISMFAAGGIHLLFFFEIIIFFWGGIYFFGCVFTPSSQSQKLRIVGIPVVDRQNLRLVKKLPAKLETRQGRECPVAAHLKLGLTDIAGPF